MSAANGRNESVLFASTMGGRAPHLTGAPSTGTAPSKKKSDGEDNAANRDVDAPAKKKSGDEEGIAASKVVEESVVASDDKTDDKDK